MVASRQAMAAAQQPLGKTSELGGVAQLVDVILDKGIVVDAWVRVSVVGLEVLAIEARVVVASVDTYLRYAEAIGRIGPAAAPSRQQSVSGGRNDQGQVLEDEVLNRLSAQLEGLQPASLQALLDAPVDQLRTLLSNLTGAPKARRDEERSFYLPDRE
jgi:gas vesicle structural protein